MAFSPIFNAFSVRPPSHAQRNLASTQMMVIKENFSIPTWLMLGALLQGLLCLLPFRNIALVAPVVLMLGFQVVRTMLIHTGFLHNPYMDGSIEGRTVALYPDESGNYEKPGDKQICAIQLAVRSHSPLGIFADGFKDVGDYFDAMAAELENDATTHGYLGYSSWMSSGNEGLEHMSLLYFDSPESLHAYAHGTKHTAAMEWWHKNEHRFKQIGIMHEVFAAPKNSWEAIYLNYNPVGLGATAQETIVDGKKVWLNPLVQGKGKLRYSKGRMGRPFAEEKEWPAFERMSNMNGAY